MTQQDVNQLLSDQLDASDKPLVDYKAASLNVDWQPDFSFVKRRIFVKSPNKSKDHSNAALPVRTYDEAVRKIDFDCLKDHIQKECSTSTHSKEKEEKSLSMDSEMKENVENNSVVENNNTTISAEEAKRLKKKRKRQKDKERKRKKRKIMQEQAMNLTNSTNMNNINTIPDVTVR